MTSLVLNQELNGVELYFDSKPIKQILETLKSNGFRWSGFKSCWYAKQNERTLKLAEQLIGEGTTSEAITETKGTIKKDSKKLMLLFDRVQFTPGNTDTSKYNYKFVGSNYTGLNTKETAKIIRQHLKARFPEVKFSVTSTYNTLDIDIKSSPYNFSKLEYKPELSSRDYREFEEEHNKEINSILEYCNRLASSYNYDDSDSYTDYFHKHYYSHVNIHYDYKQTEQTEEITKDITDFRNRLLEEEKAEEERKEKEYQEYLIKQEEEKKENEKCRKESARQIEVINNSVTIKDIEEDKQYFVIGSQFANLNKNNTLKEYKEEVNNKDYYLQDVKITKEIHFTSEEALNYFSNHLLTDFDFLEKTGGSFTDDKRFTSMVDYENMEKEERETVIFNSLGVAVYLDNKLQFVIDAQGFSYARYVGLVDNNTKIQKDNKVKQFIDNNRIEELKNKAEVLTDLSTNVITELNIINSWDSESWNQYKEAMKEQFKNNNFRITKEIIQQLEEDQVKLKAAMYKLLKEVDGIQEQFKNADLEQGQKLTIFKMSDWGMISISRIIFDSVENSSYAQYKDVIKLTFKQEKKRGLFYNHYYKDLLIYNGWLDLPTEVLNIVENTGNGITITKGKYLSCDKRQYDLILEHFITAGIKPIINTYKPIF